MWLSLIDADYKHAVLWHHDKKLVQLDAKIDKRWHVWTAPEYYHLTALEPQEPQQPLFPEPPANPPPDAPDTPINTT